MDAWSIRVCLFVQPSSKDPNGIQLEYSCYIRDLNENGRKQIIAFLSRVRSFLRLDQASQPTGENVGCKAKGLSEREKAADPGKGRNQHYIGPAIADEIVRGFMPGGRSAVRLARQIPPYIFF